MASADGNATPPTSSMDTAPSLCAKGCGFFGNPNSAGMCSKCYKETIALSASPAPSAAAAAVAPTVPSVACSPCGGIPAPAAASKPAEAASVAQPTPSKAKVEVQPAPTPTPAPARSVAPVRPISDETSDEPPKKKQVNTSRCWTCNKKIGLTGFQCKCDFFFCAEHRYSDRHECEFDYKALGKQQLSKANPTIAPSKLDVL